MALDTSVKSGIMLVRKNNGVTIGCEIIVLRRGYKRIDILNFNSFV